MKKKTEQAKILEDFAATWEQHTGRQYFINWGKEVPFANTLIEMSLTPDEYQARKAAFFADKSWWEYGKWDFAVFVKHINKCIPQTVKRKTETAPSKGLKIACTDCGTSHGIFDQCPKCHALTNGIRSPL